MAIEESKWPGHQHYLTSRLLVRLPRPWTNEKAISVLGLGVESSKTSSYITLFSHYLYIWYKTRVSPIVSVNLVWDLQLNVEQYTCNNLEWTMCSNVSYWWILICLILIVTRYEFHFRLYGTCHTFAVVIWFCYSWKKPINIVIERFRVINEEKWIQYMANLQGLKSQTLSGWNANQFLFFVEFDSIS